MMIFVQIIELCYVKFHKVIFLLYINNLVNIKKKIILFSDDTNVFYVGRSITGINNELKQTSQWFKVIKLSLNINKTSYMCFHNEPYLDDSKLKIDGLEVSRVQVTKFLGILVDEKLSWSNHVNAVCKIVLKNISVIYKVIYTCLKTTIYTCYTVH